jgi:hypothetical protein
MFLACFIDAKHFVIPSSLAPTLHSQLLSFGTSGDSPHRQATYALLRACSPQSGNIFGDSAEVATFLANQPDHPHWPRFMKSKFLDLFHWESCVGLPSLQIVLRTFQATERYLVERLAIFAYKAQIVPLNFADIHIVVTFANLFVSRHRSLSH